MPKTMPTRSVFCADLSCASAGMVQRIFFALFFAMLLVFAQQASLLHAFAHVPGATQTTQTDKQAPKQSTQHHDACGQCLATADISGAVGAKAFIFNFDANASLLLLDFQSSVNPAPLLRYHSRAPPHIA